MEDGVLLLYMLFGAVVMGFIIWNNVKDDHEEGKKAVNATSLAILVSRFFDKNDWGSK